MTPHAEPIDYLWWLMSRAAGIVALILISLSALMGLAMATKMLRRPGLKRTVVRLHEHLALTALIAIGAHGLALLGDHWLKPGWQGITVPFAMGYRPQFTGPGIIAGYLTALLGPSFYLRRRIGARRWRKLHTLIVLAWFTSAVHTLGAGSDARQPWLQALVILPGVPILYLVVVRVLSRDPRAIRRTVPRRSFNTRASTGARRTALAATESEGRARPALDESSCHENGAEPDPVETGIGRRLALSSGSSRRYALFC